MAAISIGPKFAKGAGVWVFVSPGIIFEGSGTVIAADGVVTLVFRAIAVAVTYVTVIDVAAGTLIDGSGSVIEVAAGTVVDGASGILDAGAGSVVLPAITNGAKFPIGAGVLVVISPGTLFAGSGSVIDVAGGTLIDGSGSVIDVEED